MLEPNARKSFHLAVKPEIQLVAAILFAWGLYELIKIAGHLVNTVATDAIAEQGWTALLHYEQGPVVLLLHLGMASSQVVLAVALFRRMPWARSITGWLLVAIISYKLIVFIPQFLQAFPVMALQNLGVSCPCTLSLLAFADLLKYLILLYFVSGFHEYLLLP